MSRIGRISIAITCLYAFSSASISWAGICNYMGAPEPMTVNHTSYSSDGSFDGYVIQFPDTRYPRFSVSGLPLKPGDRITVSACGCTQTGGAGKTWKDYVNPRGPNSDRLYAGTVGIGYNSGAANVPLIRISQWMRTRPQGYVIPKNAVGARLMIGFQDDDYSDNGYWGHDEGTDGQCVAMGAAEIVVRVEHARR